MQSFCPKFWRHGRVNKKSTDNVIERAERAFCFAILRRGIWAGETKKYAVLEKEVPILKVVKLFAIVTLYKFDGEEEVGSDVFLKVKENGVNIRFVAQGKGPNKVGEIVKNNEIVLKS